MTHALAPMLHSRTFEWRSSGCPGQGACHSAACCWQTAWALAISAASYTDSSASNVLHSLHGWAHAFAQAAHHTSAV